MENARNPARLELLRQEPLVLLDGAHNPNGIEALKEAVNTFLPDKPITCVMGMLADKDVDSALALLKGVFRRVLTVPVANPRAMHAGELAEKFHTLGEDAVACDTARDGVDKALNYAASENGCVLICGSLYLAGEVRPYFIKN